MSRKLLVATTAAVGFAALTLPAGLLPALAHGDHEGHQSHDHHAGHELKGFAAGQPGAADAASRTVEIVMNDAGGVMTYAPASLDVSQGEQVKFVLTNAGELDHEFMIDTVANNAAHKN